MKRRDILNSCAAVSASCAVTAFGRARAAEIVAVCDVYEPQAEKAKAWIGSGVAACGDFRRVRDRTDIDAMLVATPDHWHALITVLACQASKDVYVEKPLGHNASAHK